MKLKNGKLEMPKWMECVWRRVPCGKDECPICGKIKKDRQKHIDKGENPDDLKHVFEDVGSDFRKVLQFIKKDAAKRGIDITNIDDIKEPPEPEKFPLYRKVEKWIKSVGQLRNNAELLNEFWLNTEEAADLFWYASIFLAKVYRQLYNKWEIENEGNYGDFDYEYTGKVISECLKILKKALENLICKNYKQKIELSNIYSKLLELEKNVAKI